MWAGTASSITEKPVEASSPLVVAYTCLTPREMHIAEDTQCSTKSKQTVLQNTPSLPLKVTKYIYQVEEKLCLYFSVWRECYGH